MKIKVIKDAYYVSEDLTDVGLVSKEELESSYSHLLVKGDVWEKIDDGEGHYSNEIFKCVKGKWKGEISDGWWDYKGLEGYFEVI